MIVATCIFCHLRKRSGTIQIGGQLPYQLEEHSFNKGVDNGIHVQSVSEPNPSCESKEWQTDVASATQDYNEGCMNTIITVQVGESGGEDEDTFSNVSQSLPGCYRPQAGVEHAASASLSADPTLQSPRQTSTRKRRSVKSTSDPEERLPSGK